MLIIKVCLQNPKKSNHLTGLKIYMFKKLLFNGKKNQVYLLNDFSLGEKMHFVNNDCTENKICRLKIQIESFGCAYMLPYSSCSSDASYPHSSFLDTVPLTDCICHETLFLFPTSKYFTFWQYFSVLTEKLKVPKELWGHAQMSVHVHFSQDK